MATSGTSNFLVTEQEIIETAMKSIGKLGEGEPISPEAYSDCRFFLNMIMKQWQGRADMAPGLKTWTRQIGYRFLSSTTGTMKTGPQYPGWTNIFFQTTASASASEGDSLVSCTNVGDMSDGDYFGVILVDGSLFWTEIVSITGNNVQLLGNLPNDVNVLTTVFTYTTPAEQPIIVEAVNLRNPNMSDQLVGLMTMQQYQMLPAKNMPSNIANPTAVYVQRNLDYTTLYLDCAAANNTAWYLVIEYMVEAEDLNEPAQNPAYPKEWYRALVWALAREIAPVWNAAWTSLHENNYTQALLVARQVEPEVTAMFFQPNGNYAW